MGIAGKHLFQATKSSKAIQPPRLKTNHLLGLRVIIESIATLAICGSPFLAGDKTLYVPSVRIRELMTRVGTYDIDLCVYPRWNPAGDFPLRPVGGFPVPIDVSRTIQCIM